MQQSTNEFIAWALSNDSVEHLNKAGEKCGSLLADRPDSVDLLHLMGIIEFQLGRVTSAQTWMEKGLVHTPESIELLCNYGYILLAQKKYVEAIRAFNRCLGLKSDFVKGFVGLGTAYNELGDDARAIKYFDNILAIDPKNAEVLNDRGAILKKQGKLAEAARSFTRAIMSKPDWPAPLNNLGLVCLSLAQLDAAEDLFNKALALKPDYPEAINNLGTVYNNRGAFARSVELYKKALSLRPDYPGALNNLGTVLCQQGKFTESVEYCRKALLVQPKYPEALNNLGNALEANGDIPEAIAAYKQAIAIKSDNADYHKNLGMALLAAGKFDEGWPEYEWRWKTKQFAQVPMDFAKAQWKGEEAKGRVLLIRSEQGFGDSIQFCRYAMLAALQGFFVVLEVQPALVRLMETLAGVKRVISQGEAVPDHDFFCPMMSLPVAFHTKPDTIPAQTPYLSAAHESVALWKTRLTKGVGDMLKVGIAWAGKPRFQSPDLIAVDKRRSMSPDLFAALIKIKGVRLFSLQKGGPQAPSEFGFIDYMTECDDFAETAALMANLDLIISVDTAVAHVAGALGRPVWLLNRFDTCWRWMRGRDDSPWYPTMRLFRQPRPGDWGGVLSQVEHELRKVVAQGRIAGS